MTLDRYFTIVLTGITYAFASAIFLSHFESQLQCLKKEVIDTVLDNRANLLHTNHRSGWGIKPRQLEQLTDVLGVDNSCVFDEQI
jgi:hypothetical protein